MMVKIRLMRIFYHEAHDDMSAQYPVNPSEHFKSQWLARITDLIDQHDPDLLYTDGAVPFGTIGLEMTRSFV